MKTWFASMVLGLALFGGMANADVSEDISWDAESDYAASYTCTYSACGKSYSGYGATEWAADSAAEQSCRRNKFNCNQDCVRRSCRPN